MKFENMINWIKCKKDLPLPTSLSYNLTDRCQSRCKTCNCWTFPAETMYKEMTTDDWKTFLTNMHNWLGNYNFILSGGEPFLRKDIFDIAEYASNLGDTVNVITNGLSLGDKINEIINSKFNHISFSLNSIKDPSIHNTSRGRDDAFDLTMDALLKLIDANKNLDWPQKKSIGIATIIMPTNLNELQELAYFAKEKDINITFQLLDNGEAFHTVLNRNVSIHENNIQTSVLEALDNLIKLKQDNFPISNSIEQLKLLKLSIENPDKIKQFKCTIGENNFAVDPYGNVRICFSMDPVGNIKDSLPQDLWNSKIANSSRKAILKCTKNCKLLNCNTKNLLD